MARLLIFVLAPEAALPSSGADWSALQEAQRRGIGSGVALRMYRAPESADAALLSVKALVAEGQARASGEDPFPEQKRRLVCDAVVPYLDAKALWLGVYALEGILSEVAAEPRAARHPAERLQLERCQCLDRFPLREAANETCWFYPTDDGTYVCWENRRQLELLPGHVAEASPAQEPIDYQRSDVHLLWSLMADDEALTCVGLTYRHRRIDWLVQRSLPEACATWTAFRVDAMAETQYQELDSATLVPELDPPLDPAGRPGLD